MQVHHGDVVDAGGHEGAQHQRDHAARGGGAAARVGPGALAHRQHATSGVQRQLALGQPVAPVHRRAELLQPLRAPAHGHAQLPRRPGHHQVLGVQAGLHAEAAAHVAHLHPHVLGLQARQQRGQRVADAGGHLVADGHQQPARAGLGLGHRHPRLDRRGRQALVGDLHPHHVRGAGEGGLAGCGVAVATLGHHVVRRALQHLRRIRRERGAQVGDDRQLLVVHQHGLGRVHRLGAGVGHHRRHRLAHVVHGVDGQPPARRRHRLGAVRSLERRRRAGQGLHARGRQFGPRVDGQHAGHGAGLGRVDAEDARVRVRRAQEHQVLQPLARQVVGVAAAARHQGRVLDAAHGVAAAEAQGVGGGARQGLVGGVHAATPSAVARIARAACFTAATMLT